MYKFSVTCLMMNKTHNFRIFQYLFFNTYFQFLSKRYCSFRFTLVKRERFLMRTNNLTKALSDFSSVGKFSSTKWNNFELECHYIFVLIIMNKIKERIPVVFCQDSVLNPMCTDKLQFWGKISK